MGCTPRPTSSLPSPGLETPTLHLGSHISYSPFPQQESRNSSCQATEMKAWFLPSHSSLAGWWGNRQMERRQVWAKAVQQRRAQVRIRRCHPKRLVVLPAALVSSPSKSGTSFKGPSSRKPSLIQRLQSHSSELLS